MAADEASHIVASALVLARPNRPWEWAIGNLGGGVAAQIGEGAANHDVVLNVGGEDNVSRIVAYRQSEK